MRQDGKMGAKRAGTVLLEGEGGKLEIRVTPRVEAEILRERGLQAFDGLLRTMAAPLPPGKTPLETVLEKLLTVPEPGTKKVEDLVLGLDGLLVMLDATPEVLTAPETQ